MNLTIDPLNSTTGWSATGDALIAGINDHAQFIANDDTGSLILRFSGTTGNATKTVSPAVDVSAYTELVIQVYSPDFDKGARLYRKFTDFPVTLNLGGANSYYIPLTTALAPVIIDISNVDTITEITFASVVDETFNLVVSHVTAIDQEFPLDIFIGVKERLDAMFANYQNQYQVATVTAAAGDTTITLTPPTSDGPEWLERYACIRITDGTNTERHQINTYEVNPDGTATATFFSGLDGTSIVNPFTDADVYLHIPIEYTRADKDEIRIPGVTIWGIEPENFPIDSDIQSVFDTFTTGDTSTEREIGRFYSFPITIDVEARHDQILNEMSTLVRQYIGQKFTWVNNQKIFQEFDGTAIEVEPTEYFNVIPKIQYRTIIRVREETWQRISQVRTTTTDTTATIR